MKIPNSQQQSVIDQLDENIILFASAGTGKTFTVANRIANILLQGRAKAEEVLCLTFTIKACNELKEDIFGYVGEQGKEVKINTIHSFCYQLIAEEYKRTGSGFADLGVCDEIDQEEILKSILSSRLAAWHLEEECANLGICYPDISSLDLCETDEETFLRFGDRAITPFGRIIKAPREEACLPVERICPICGEKREVIGQKCAVCGESLPFTFANAAFDIYTKKAAIRNLISQMKHVRQREKYYSEDVEADYQRAFDFIKEKDESAYEAFTSYNAGYGGYLPDEEYQATLEKFAGRLAKEYDEHLRLSNLVDFDDLILNANAILQTEEGLARWSTAFKYIVVDEMQDTSVLEYEVLKKLFTKNNIMLCGDFFQTIYGWRGSRPEEILEKYRQEFSAKPYMLSENYRSTKTLAEASFAYLKNTYPQWIGRYCPENLQINSQTEGEKIFCYAFDNREEEAWKIYRYLLRNRPQKASNICIIARSNRYIAELYAYFEKFNRENEQPLRFFTVEENFQFFKKPVIKDILAVLKLIINPFDRVSMERLTGKFVRNVGPKRIEYLRRQNEFGASILSFLDEGSYLFGDPYHQLIEGYNQKNIVVYDTETTGLDLSKDEIVQLSAIKLAQNGDIIDILDIMVEPSIPIQKGAVETHGFDLEYIRTHGGVTAKEALTAFSAFAKDCVLVGHNNLAYDRPLVDRQLRENDLPPLTITAEYDTLPIAKQFYPDLENYKLSTLCGQFSIVNDCAHNALGDITATGKCLLRIIRDKIIPTALKRRVIVAKYAESFEKFFAFMQEVRRRFLNGEPIIEYIIDRLLLKKKYTTNSDYAAMRDIVEEFTLQGKNPRAQLQAYLKDAALSGSQMDVFIQRLNRIPMITIHQAKGCEFDTVILVGADDNNFPNYAAKQADEEDEEKKVFYVAITRAKKQLILTRAKYIGRYERKETPYFWSIPEEYVHVNQAWKNG